MRPPAQKQPFQPIPVPRIPSSAKGPRSDSKKAWLRRMERIDDLFFQYGKKRSTTDSFVELRGPLISPGGIEALCSDIGIDHRDIKILMLAWKMNAERHGYFTLAEWRRGLMAIKAGTIRKLKQALEELEKKVRKSSDFVGFYEYTFKYVMTEGIGKGIDIETICQLLDVVLGSQFRSEVDFFIEYLKFQNDYKVVTFDQWIGFYRFCRQISFPDMSNYDPEHSWPVILDDFVEWIREKKSS